MEKTFENIESLARDYILSHKVELIRKFANLDEFPPVNNPQSFFMAGSPGAGKTEYSKAFINKLCSDNSDLRIVRIDADEIRDFIPYFNGANSELIQSAAALGVEKLFDYCQKHNQNLLLDGTFAKGDKSINNIKRAIARGRKVGIIYIYQDPLIAWDFTQKREKVEGRVVPKEAFVKAFFKAKKNVQIAKELFGSKVNLDLVINNADNDIEKYYINIDNIDRYIKVTYTGQELTKLL